MENKITFYWVNGNVSTFGLDAPLSKDTYNSIQKAFRKRQRYTLQFSDGVVMHFDFADVQLIQYEPAPPAPVTPKVTVDNAQPGTVISGTPQ